ncbi:MAG TPA: hypothetical protein VF629_06185 [Hymenobacter sp.]|jgi:hypothetical protein|uniref:hypothetical protein n=1 Tax=Hymenobacter sp. TaxID=1898978 RepID=UPI002ED8B266
MKAIPVLLAVGILALSNHCVYAQGRGDDKDKGKDKKEYKYGKDKKYKEYKGRKKDDKERYKDDDRYKDRDGRYDNGNGRTTRTGGVLGGILGRVVLPPAGTAGPRRLEGVPRGHYPPPGECRISGTPTAPPDSNRRPAPAAASRACAWSQAPLSCTATAPTTPSTTGAKKSAAGPARLGATSSTSYFRGARA